MKLVLSGIFLSGTLKQVNTQLNSIITYYGSNAKMCEIIANERLIGGRK